MREAPPGRLRDHGAMPHRFLMFLALILVSVVPISLFGGSCVESQIQSPFLVKNLSIQPTKAQPNEVITITVSVTNTHHSWGIYSLVLKINGVEEAHKQANVDAGDTRDVSFSVTREKPGKYAVFINGLSSSFSVVAPP